MTPFSRIDRFTEGRRIAVMSNSVAPFELVEHLGTRILREWEAYECRDIVESKAPANSATRHTAYFIEENQIIRRFLRTDLMPVNYYAVKPHEKRDRNVVELPEKR